MASRISPYVDNTGLVFAYDLANVQRSYLGEPTVNYVPGSYGYALYAYASGPVDTGVVNEKGDLITAKRYTITNAVNTARAAIFPSGLTTGVAYTFSFKWKYNGSTTTSPSVSVSAAKGNPEGNNNSFTSQTGDTVNIGNGWYLTTYTFIFSSVPTSACILTFGISTGSTAGYVGETFDIYEAQFEIKDHRTQYSNGTRSVTQGLKDLAGNSTIDLTNVSFDSNAQMTFDGTNDYVNVPYNTALNTPNGATYEIMLYPQGAGEFLSRGKSDSGTDPDNPRFYRGSDGSLYFDWSSTGADTYAQTVAGVTPSNKWTHIIGVATPGDQLRVFINGVQASYGATLRTLPATLPNTADPLVIGGVSWIPRYFPGKIGMVKLYNRALSASEIQQNFNAIKGRYGL